MSLKHRGSGKVRDVEGRVDISGKRCVRPLAEEVVSEVNSSLLHR
jgi:hypothetical protein